MKLGKNEKKNICLFSVVWAVIFIAIFIYKYYAKGIVNLWVLILFILFFSGILAPKFMKIPYKLWMKFAFALGKMNTNIIMSILYFLFFVPLGFVLKIFGNDFLERKINKQLDSYFLEREEQPGSMKNQF